MSQVGVRFSPCVLQVPFIVAGFLVRIPGMLSRMGLIAKLIVSALVISFVVILWLDTNGPPEIDTAAVGQVSLHIT